MLLGFVRRNQQCVHKSNPPYEWVKEEEKLGHFHATQNSNRNSITAWLC